MRIALGADHGGYAYKEALIHFLHSKGYEILDFGPSSEEQPVDYPDFAQKVAKALAHQEADYGILICKSAIGMYIAANRIKGARAVHCHNENATLSSRKHNNANIACFGSSVQTLEEVQKLLTLFLNTPFEGERHEKRVEKMDKI